MKGVILGINSAARIVDLTHEIPPGDLRGGAFALATSFRFFPKGTVHLAVVDPGVGTARRAIAVKTSRFFFVGPDNGVLSWALAREDIVAIHELQNTAFFLRPVSRTFHGRDVFAPAAAHLSRGVPLRRLGPALEEIVRLPWPEPRRAGDQLRGEVVYVDRFGNAITNIDPGALGRFSGAGFRVFRQGKRLCDVAECYAAVAAGHAVAIMGSTGFLEIAVNGGNASRQLNLPVGTVVSVRCR